MPNATKKALCVGKSTPARAQPPASPEDLWNDSTRDVVVRKAGALAQQCHITNGSSFRLKGHDPSNTMGFASEGHPVAREARESGLQAVSELQDMLYAVNKWAVLLIFQGMDASGEDGAIKHVMSGVNPEGCQVYSFKEPSSEDLDHGLPFALRQVSAQPRRNRHLQPQLLRGDPGSSRIPRFTRQRKDPAVSENGEHLEGPFRRDP